MKKIGILIVSYNAVTTIASVLRRINDDVWKEIEEVAIFDDASNDDTHILAHGYANLNNINKITIIKNLKNLGYGGNQKAGYAYFIKKGFDVVVLLHGDGQYAPEILKKMYDPIVCGQADAVFGSRMLPNAKNALQGGMPIYKFVGNKILTYFENKYLKMKLSEFHSGYRAYSLRALKEINLSELTDDFYFDTQIIIKLHHQNKHIMEIPIPTYYGSEICYVNGLKYAKNIFKTLIHYHKTVSGIQSYPCYAEYFPFYPARIKIANSSHSLLLQLSGSNKTILDVGCGDISFASCLAKNNNSVYGIDIIDLQSERKAMISGFKQHNLESGLILEENWPKKYDIILLGDILEHLKKPEKLLQDCRTHLAQGGVCIASLPNIANITCRIRLLFGVFSYSDRGIFDKTHIRFYTFKTATALFQQNKFIINKTFPTLLPITLLMGDNFLGRIAAKCLYVITRIFPKLFAYQFVFVLTPNHIVK